MSKKAQTRPGPQTAESDKVKSVYVVEEIEREATINLSLVGSHDLRRGSGT